MKLESLERKVEVAKLKAKVLDMLLLIETDQCYGKESIKEDLCEVFKMTDMMDYISFEEIA